MSWLLLILSLQFFNNWSSELFTKKSGDAETEDILVYGKDGQSTWAEAKNGDFRVTFIPWDPENSAFPMSAWSFECFSEDFQATGYPAQICGKPAWLFHFLMFRSRPQDP